MRRSLRLGSERLELLERDERLLTFRDGASALSFVNSFRNDKTAIAALQERAIMLSPDLPDPGTEEFFVEIAALLSSGKLKILRSPLKTSLDSSEEPPESGQSAARAAARPDNWIEIYLRDSDDQPLPGARYRLKLPDGSLQEGILDAFGHAEHYGISPGICEVCFPDLDEGAWEKLKTL